MIVENSVRNGWIRGKVLEVCKGMDGRARRAVVQTSKGILRRPMAKLAKLDLDSGETGTELPYQCYGPGNVTNPALMHQLPLDRISPLDQFSPLDKILSAPACYR